MSLPLWPLTETKVYLAFQLHIPGRIVAHLYTFHITKCDVAFTLPFLDLPLLWLSLNYCFELPSINLTTSFGFYGQ